MYSRKRAFNSPCPLPLSARAPECDRSVNTLPYKVGAHVPIVMPWLLGSRRVMQHSAPFSICEAVRSVPFYKREVVSEVQDWQ